MLGAVLLFCFLVCFREEHGVRKWKRLLGLKLNKNEEQEEEEGEGEGEKLKRHGGEGCGGLRVRRGRILRSGCGVG